MQRSAQPLISINTFCWSDCIVELTDIVQCSMDVSNIFSFYVVVGGF